MPLIAHPRGLSCCVRLNDVAASQRLEVDGEMFDVTPHETAPNQFHITWVSGRNAGYGFTASSGDDPRPTQEWLVDSVRFFLAQIDPATGFMAD